MDIYPVSQHWCVCSCVSSDVSQQHLVEETQIIVSIPDIPCFLEQLRAGKRSLGEADLTARAQRMARRGECATCTTTLLM